MTRFLIYSGLLLAVLSLGISLLMTVQFNKNLVRTKEVLILKNDSLHMLQLQTKKELNGMRNYMDSTLAKEKKELTIK
jgi:sensor domain CHASE-containing protein